MIKTNTQFRKSQERLNLIRDQLQQYQSKKLSINEKFLLVPLEAEKKNIEDQIKEYLDLTKLPFETAVQFVLNKHILIDNIGELLSKLRIAAKLSQSEMAERLGWEQSNLSRFESENYGSQTISKIVEYVSALGVWLHVTPAFEEQIDTQIEGKDNLLFKILGRETNYLKHIALKNIKNVWHQSNQDDLVSRLVDLESDIISTTVTTSSSLTKLTDLENFATVYSSNKEKELTSV